MLHLLEAISMTTPVSFRPICYICNKPVKPQFGNGVDELGSCCSWGVLFPEDYGEASPFPHAPKTGAREATERK
jgi:hypothetical protein